MDLAREDRRAFSAFRVLLLLLLLCVRARGWMCNVGVYIGIRALFYGIGIGM